MKPTEETRICDRCKNKVAKNKCIGCEDDLCNPCSFVFAIEFNTTSHNKKRTYNPLSASGSVIGPSPQSLYPYANPFNPGKTLAKSSWIICKRCKDALENKDALEVIKESEEMKKLVEKIKKTVLSSRMLSGLEESEIKDDEDEDEIIGNPFGSAINSTYRHPKKGFFSSMFSGKKKKSSQFHDDHDSYY